MRNLLLIFVAILAITFFGLQKLTSPHPRNTPTTQSTATDNVQQDDAGVAVANAALSASGIDVSALSDITDKLEGACNRNKFGLSEEACVQAIESHKDECTQKTAQKYPGQLSDVNRMQVVVNSYVNCIFVR